MPKSRADRFSDRVIPRLHVTRQLYGFQNQVAHTASDERPRLVSVAQRCRMTVGRHRRLTVVELGRRSDAVFPLILKHFDCLPRVAAEMQSIPPRSTHYGTTHD